MNDDAILSNEECKIEREKLGYIKNFSTLERSVLVFTIKPTKVFRHKTISIV